MEWTPDAISNSNAHCDDLSLALSLAGSLPCCIWVFLLPHARRDPHFRLLANSSAIAASRRGALKLQTSTVL